MHITVCDCISNSKASSSSSTSFSHSILPWASPLVSWTRRSLSSPARSASSKLPANPSSSASNLLCPEPGKSTTASSAHLSSPISTNSTSSQKCTALVFAHFSANLHSSTMSPSSSADLHSSTLSPSDSTNLQPSHSSRGPTASMVVPPSSGTSCAQGRQHLH